MARSKKKSEPVFKQLEIAPRKAKKEKDPKVGRIWVAATLLATVGLSGIFWAIRALPTIDFKNLEIKKPSLSFKNTNLSFYSGKESISATREKSVEDFLLIVNKHIEGKKGVWSVKVSEIDGSFSAQVESERKMAAASLIKLPVVASLYHQVEAGNISLSDEYQIEEEDVRGGAGSLQYQPAGTMISLQDLAFYCLNQSDNTAFTMLRRILGDDLVQKEIDKLGMESTVLADNTTSAKDIDLFFQKLYRGQITKNYKDDFIKGLTKTAFETRIPAGIPEGVSVAHKVGTDTKVVSDAGIVIVPKKSFILTILSEGVSSQEADQIIVDLTRDIYWFIVSD